jgi:hypothetical protein
MSHRVTVQLQDEDVADLAALAGRMGINRSQLLRRLVRDELARVIAGQPIRVIALEDDGDGDQFLKVSVHVIPDDAPDPVKDVFMARVNRALGTGPCDCPTQLSALPPKPPLRAADFDYGPVAPSVSPPPGDGAVVKVLAKQEALERRTNVLLTIEHAEGCNAHG